MALTITQLQAFIDTKPDVRSIVNEIADYLQANPGGEGGFPSIINENTTVNMNGKVLSFILGGVPLLSIDPTVGAQAAIIQAYDPTDEGSSASVILNSNPSLSRSELWADFNDGVKRVTIVAEAQASGGTIVYTADSHTFPVFAGGGTTGASIDNDGKLIRTP